MYKKITHTIVEEHFGHSDSSNLKQSENVTSGSKSVQPKISDRVIVQNPEVSGLTATLSNRQLDKDIM
jgi:hypothetical protein